MKKEQILGIIRHALTTIGGFFIAKGYLSESLIEEISAGALIIIGTVWSIIEKLKK